MPSITVLTVKRATTCFDVAVTITACRATIDCDCDSEVGTVCIQYSSRVHAGRLSTLHTFEASLLAGGREPNASFMDSNDPTAITRQILAHEQHSSPIMTNDDF